MPNKATGLLIKQLKANNGMTSTELAKLVGVNKPSITKWETTGQVSLENLCKLSTIFRVSVQELLEGKLRIEGNPEYFKRNYDISSFDLDEMLMNQDEEGLTAYYETCLRIKERFLQLTPLFAADKLTDTLLEEWQYLKKYVYLDANVLPKYERESTYAIFENGGEDKNQMAATKEFLERINGLSKEEKSWEMDKLVNFRLNLKPIEAINTGLISLIKPLFDSIPQVLKDLIISDYMACSPLQQLLNGEALEIMLNAGANIVLTYADTRLPALWDNDFLAYTKGRLMIDEDYPLAPGIEEIHSFTLITSSNEWKHIPYGDYQRFVDARRTRCLHEIIRLRKEKPTEYIQNLLDGKYLFPLHTR